jgi:hypothetical protein
MTKWSVVVGVLVAAAGLLVAAEGPVWQSPPPGSYIPLRLNAVFSLDLRAEPEEVIAAAVTPEFFGRLSPVIGRFLTAADGGARDFNPAVISYNLWQSRLRGDNATIGLEILVESNRTSIVGVAPASFDAGDAGWIWIPRVRRTDDAAMATAIAGIEGVWNAEFSREGLPRWPTEQAQRPLAALTRGTFSSVALGTPSCNGCVPVRGLLKVPFDAVLPAGPPVRIRLIPERPPGDQMSAVNGFLMPGGRLQLRTTSGNCAVCGEIALEGLVSSDAVSGNWNVETAAVSRPGERGTFSLRRTARLPAG